ncbi:hypothetical protein FRB90_003222 [Tulasnella sp. 427]|nr:hypothetical protein FRB90_003222 [Tulasnella sp. 427]
MGALCSKLDTHSGGHQVLGSSDQMKMSERSAAPQTIGAAPASRIPVSSEKKITTPAAQPKSTAAATTTSMAAPTATTTTSKPSSHQRTASAGSISKSAIPVPTRTTSPPLGQRTVASPAVTQQVSKKDMPKKSKGKGAPTPSPDERRAAALAAAEKRANADQTRGIQKANPNAGKLSAKLQDEKTAKPSIAPGRDGPDLVWD